MPWQSHTVNKKTLERHINNVAITCRQWGEVLFFIYYSILDDCFQSSKTLIYEFEVSRLVKTFHPEELLCTHRWWWKHIMNSQFTNLFPVLLKWFLTKLFKYKVLTSDHKKSNCPCHPQFHHKACPWIKNAATPQQQNCLATVQHPSVWKSPRSLYRRTPSITKVRV